MKILDRPYGQARPARIERMIEAYRLAKHRRLMRMAMKLWRQTATDQQLAKLDQRPDLIH